MSLKATRLRGLSRMHTQQSPTASASVLSTLEGTGAQRQLFIMRSFVLLFFTLLLVSHGSSAVITGSENCHSASHPDTRDNKPPAILRCFVEACEKDPQCGGGMCCAVSLWIRSLRMCTPAGQEGDDCHPMSHKIPFNGRRLHHTCPCLPNLSCITIVEGRSKCLSPNKYPGYL